MNLRQALTFLTVAELGTVSKAALRLRVAQPALSRQIIGLEQELGLRLFDRVGRRLLLTGEGEQLIAGCRLLLNSVSSLQEQAQLLRQGDTGVLKIAGSPQHIESVLSQFLHLYAKRYPKVEIRIREGTGSEILMMLERGEIHLGQNLLHAVRLDEQHFGSLPLGSVQLLAGCHPSVALGPNRTIEIADLAQFPLLLLDGGFGFRRAFDAASRMAGLKPTIAFESRNPHTLLALAEAGHGVAIVPSQLQCWRYRLRIVGLTHRRRPLQEPLTISWDKRRSLPRFATDYCVMLAAHMRETFPITRPTEPVTAKRSVRSRGKRVSLQASRNTLAGRS
ncbi:DNA-binding transcriptional LysR family regulator [Bradyrhizobium japonicum]|jgi:LysR family nitrogen assimilation transcriptional regulator|uniref:LysR family transcriptional regulator n=1 Tax=Bradyrhizobium TaxID=374 RepID=UPI0004877B10|nr:MULTISPECIES: LysR family transcriptional regulator [Bradyrhizobium]MBR0879223.1 LysR family transcriptional regulator [Bradyrhizobium liaoningense]MBR0941821.1 LysR family transcriptional regulator [Bradyrhizobium liaoningense]MBR0998556.1 LysR family transcriptional regulator [Bradyrhizobium liaoningense]MBR1028073.1 LysR family transcriptional regulator [Bradyrhizobium liaoningense]MBR1065770.1 LysR family transcriptional regulator [Bradyrhizobium liaoningense]